MLTTGARWSTGEIMMVIILIAVELAVFQGVWWIIVMPPILLALLTINLGVLFCLLGGRRWQDRIIGMLLGGILGLVVSLVFYAVEIRLGRPGVIAGTCLHLVESWTGALRDPGGVVASTFRLIGRRVAAIEGGLLDILGIAAIWAGGRVDHRYRHRSGRREAGRLVTAQGQAAPMS